MERKQIESKAAISVGYDEPSQTLEIEFKHGIYQYYNVPQVVFDQMLVSDSIGTFINVNIKPVFPYSRV
jgi:hypothetical protein